VTPGASPRLLVAEPTFRGGDHAPINAALVAMAKARASEAVGVITAIAHGVHGAIGITQEYPLHFLTRRLHEWRMDFGSETYWQQRLGSAFLSSPSTRALDFVLESLSP
jgi:alkylation response protein AidB-like acyl-CoA dehydrogenase